MTCKRKKPLGFLSQFFYQLPKLAVGNKANGITFLLCHLTLLLDISFMHPVQIVLIHHVLHIGEFFQQEPVCDDVVNTFFLIIAFRKNVSQIYQLVNLRDILAKCDDKEECINNIIANWFLLKKFSYVQYMMDKNNLNRVHEGNVKKQRQVAKEKCDAIGFVSYSELWKLVKELR